MQGNFVAIQNVCLLIFLFASFIDALFHLRISFATCQYVSIYTNDLRATRQLEHYRCLMKYCYFSQIFGYNRDILELLMNDKYLWYIDLWPSRCSGNRCIRSKISGYNLDCRRVELSAICDATGSRSYLPTPPLGQDMTQGQFLSGV